MRYIFFGTPEFAAIILEKIIKADCLPEAVICNPDRPVGRKKIITPPSTKILAQKYNIPVLQPEKLDSNFRIQISSFKPDLIVVTAYSQIIPKEILDIPQIGAIGIHPSLLPKYRGSSPIQTAILNGDKETGISLYLMDEKIDHGKIFAQEKKEIDKLNYIELAKELAELGGKMLSTLLLLMGAREIKSKIDLFKVNLTDLREQDHKQATYTKKFATQDGFIDLKKDKAEIIERKIRALNPEPGVFTFINGKRTKLLEAEIKDQKLIITKIQTEGKKPQKVR